MMGCTETAMVKSAACPDRISSLPEETKGYILSKLNVQDAVRASVLSSAWRNVWTTMPEIHLSDMYSRSGSSDASPTNAGSKFITLVDLALSLHEGHPILVSIHGNRSYHDVFERWMYMLSRSEPCCIKIKLISDRKYKIPSSLFSIRRLMYLRLQNCIISLPRMFGGFKWLTYLKLKYLSSTDEAINNLISSCPMLRSLDLRYFEGIKCLNIQASVLEYLEVEGEFEELHLHAPNLVHAYFTHVKTADHQSVPVARDGRCYLKQAFGSLTDIETLSVSGSFLTYLSKGCILTKLPGVFHHLVKICIEICCFWNWTEVLAACSLFQSAPMFRELDIMSYRYPEAFGRKRIWDQNQTGVQKPSLDHLMKITFDDFMGYDCEVAFIGMLLSWAPALKELKILRNELQILGVDEKADYMWKVLTKLLALPRASDKAMVIFT